MARKFKPGDRIVRINGNKGDVKTIKGYNGYGYYYCEGVFLPGRPDWMYHMEIHSRQWELAPEINEEDIWE